MALSATDTFVELSELVLKKNIFEFNGIKFASPSSILFMAELEEKVIEEVDNKPYLWWGYVDDIFFIWKHGEEKLTVKTSMEFTQ